MASFFYLLEAEDNHTATLARSLPSWGRPLTGLPAKSHFHMSDWHDLPHVVLYRLARHRARLANAAAATCCVIASPMGSRNPTAEARNACRPGIAARLAELGERHCPGRPLVVIGGPDADGSGTALCSGLWGAQRSCEKGLADPIVRVTGNVPGLQSEVAGRGTRGFCRRLVVPYLSHARTPLLAAQQRHQMGPGGKRALRIAYAAASWGHVDADAHGFVAWRKALRNACRALEAHQCQWVWISMSGNGAEKAIQRYADADFCLQPPGDTLPRPGIVDALSVGCVPVLFHPGQQTLWPDHWPSYNESSVLLDWTDGAPRPRVRDHKQYAERARQALQTLLAIQAPELQRLQRGLVAAAPNLIYREPLMEPAALSGSSVAIESSSSALPSTPPSTSASVPSLSASSATPPTTTLALEMAPTWMDAVDVLVERLRGVRRVATGDEAAAFARYLEARRAMVEAQRRYEESRPVRSKRRSKAKAR